MLHQGIKCQKIWSNDHISIYWIREDWIIQGTIYQWFEMLKISPTKQSLRQSKKNDKNWNKNEIKRIKNDLKWEIKEKIQIKHQNMKELVEKIRESHEKYE